MRRYYAAAGLGGFLVAAAMGAQGHDPTEPKVVIGGRPGGSIEITLSVGSQSKSVVVQPTGVVVHPGSDGKFRIVGDDSEIEATQMVLRLPRMRPVASVPNEPQLAPIEPSEPGEADRPPIAVPPHAARVPELAPADDPKPDVSPPPAAQVPDLAPADEPPPN